MKQHITVEQLNELSEKGKEKLREWWKDSIYKGIDSDSTWTLAGEWDDPTLCQFMRIGQMIEFLDEHNPISIMGHQSQWHGGNWYYNGGDIPTELTETALEESCRSYEATELCDALWAAVKEVLEK